MRIASIAASGMHAAALRQQVAASNVARQGAVDSPRQGVTTSTLAGGGVWASVTVEPADALAPATDLVDGMAAGHDFRATARALARAAELIGSLLDVLA